MHSRSFRHFLPLDGSTYGSRCASLFQNQSSIDPRSLGQEGLQLISCEHSLRRQTDSHRVHLGVVDDEFVVKVVSGRKARRAYIADYLALPDACAWYHSICDPVLVIEGRLIAVRVTDDGLTAIAATPAGLFDDAVPGSDYRRASWGRPIDSSMSAGVAEYRVASIAEARRESPVRNRIAEEKLPGTTPALVEVADSAVLHLKAIECALGTTHGGPHEQEFRLLRSVVLAIRL